MPAQATEFGLRLAVFITWTDYEEEAKPHPLVTPGNHQYLPRQPHSYAFKAALGPL